MENFPECLAEDGKINEATMVTYLDMKKRLLSGESRVEDDVHLIDAKGNWHWRRISYQLEIDSTGKPVRAIGCSREVTEQKELEQKYMDQLAYRNNIAKNSLFSMRVDLDENRLLEHTSTEERLEACVREGMDASELFHIFAGNATDETEAGSIERCFERESLLQEYENGEMQLHARYKCRLLQIYIELQVSLMKNPTTGHCECFCVFLDVNETCMTQKAFSAIANTSYDFVGIANTVTSGFFCLAYSSKKFVPKKYSEGYDEKTRAFADRFKDRFLTAEDYHAAREDVTIENVKAHLEEGPLYEFNVRLKGEDSGTITYRMSFCYIDEERTQILVSRANVTKAVYEEERNQQMLASALEAAEQASRAKSEFLSRMSHEIRTPMNAIIGISTLAVNDVHDPAMMEDDLSKIIMSARYLLSLINDILDMSRIESGRMSLSLLCLP